jgi:hypothetical protein
MANTSARIWPPSDPDEILTIERLAHWAAAWAMFDAPPLLGVQWTICNQLSAGEPSPAGGPAGHAHNNTCTSWPRAPVGLGAYLLMMAAPSRRLACCRPEHRLAPGPGAGRWDVGHLWPTACWITLRARDDPAGGPDSRAGRRLPFHKGDHLTPSRHEAALSFSIARRAIRGK